LGFMLLYGPLLVPLIDGLPNDWPVKNLNGLRRRND
jgi:hypothetical protein